MHKLTRRNVIVTLSASSVMLCPAVLTAQADWGEVAEDRPLGQDQLLTVPAGPARIEISGLAPGQVAVIARPTTDDNYSNTGMTQFVGVLHRTEAQIAYGAANDRAGVVQDPRYLVVNLVCPHRGKAIGITGDANVPFACTDRGSRHSSDFDAAAMGTAGASDGDPMSIPDYTIEGAGTEIVLNLA